jgi:hypothetical protein
MERESFEDEEVARLLNGNYISIKVDREERPDIDKIYMDVCQALTGHGGWPLTIIMTPDKLPFFAATYLPKENRAGLSGMMELLPHLARLWKEDHRAVIESSESIKNSINRFNTKIPGGNISQEVIHQAYNHFAKSFDSIYGGFGSAPKFPSPHNLYFLMRYYLITGENNALKMVEKTLQKMYQGGIYDHIGFGFARYSTDKRWLVPHFEKMLYDNALLTIAYLEAHQLTGKEEYSRIARDILTYIQRDMTSPEGGFYTAQDADSDGEEGKFYLWSVDEVLGVLGEEEGRCFCEIYGITREGNFEGKNIPNLNNSFLDETDKKRVDAWREKLFDYRAQRIPPFKDDKILTSWNGLMIAAFARGHRILNNPGYLDTARKAVDFILTRLRREDGRLLARYREGQAHYSAYAADYAYLIWGLIELYEACFEVWYLKKALDLNDELIKLFWDHENGGLYLYGEDSEQLFTRPKESYDGAVPSANSVALMNLLRLARMTGNTDLEAKVEKQIQLFSSTVKSSLTAHSFFLSSVIFTLDSSREIVIVGKKDNLKTRLMIETTNKYYLPNTTIVFKSEDNEIEINKIAPYIEGIKMINEDAAVYVCENYSCQEPITSTAKLNDYLNKISQ